MIYSTRYSELHKWMGNWIKITAKVGFIAQSKSKVLLLSRNKNRNPDRIIMLKDSVYLPMHNQQCSIVDRMVINEFGISRMQSEAVTTKSNTETLIS